MKAIGGYFELELRKGEHYHQNALRLNTARNCFEYVLQARKYRKVYVPYYTCEVMLEPIRKLDIRCEFYHVNEKLEPTFFPKLNDNEAFLYTNYFGLKQECVKRLASEYGNQLVVDNAQAFYAEPLDGIDTFYSARKFFGVPDGAYLYTDCLLQEEIEQDYSYDRMNHLLKRIDLGAEKGFQDFRTNDDSLCNQGIKQMSELTKSILLGVDYEEVKRKRKENYAILDAVLKNSNHLQFQLDDESVPMVYPYLTEDTALRQKLISNKVFVATYWPNVMEWCKPDDWEYKLAEGTVFLPIDQRYTPQNMSQVLEMINHK